MTSLTVTASSSSLTASSFIVAAFKFECKQNCLTDLLRHWPGCGGTPVAPALRRQDKAKRPQVRGL